MEPSATVILDSINRRNRRLTTMEVVIHRFMLPELNTHRDFSRNSASSRAIPFEKQLRLIEENGIAYPLVWPREQKGMQGGPEFIASDAVYLKMVWDNAAIHAMNAAKSLHRAGVHKSVINRLLEPFLWHKVIITSTNWENFFAQRCSPLAQPEIRAAAEAMEGALAASTPGLIKEGDWHMPYLDAEDLQECWLRGIDPRQVSAMRCARVSYLTHDGVRDVQLDADRYRDLIGAHPPHWSPLEHVATPTPQDQASGANFRGWTQLRTMVGG